MHIDLVFILMLALSMTYWAYPDAHNFGAAPIFCLKNALVQNKCIGEGILGHLCVNMKVVYGVDL